MKGFNSAVILLPVPYCSAYNGVTSIHWRDGVRLKPPPKEEERGWEQGCRISTQLKHHPLEIPR